MFSNTKDKIINCLGDGNALREPSPKFDQGERPRASENARKAASVDPGETEPPVAEMTISASEQRAHGLIRGFSLVLKHHNAAQSVQDSLRNQLLAYLMKDGDAPLAESAFVKRAKYVTCAPMSWYLKNGCEPLKMPPTVWKPVGQFKKWARRRLWDRSVKNTHLWYSWLQGKRAALPLSDEMVLSAYEEHRVAMGGTDPIDTDTLDGVMEQLEPRVARYAQELTKAYMPATLEEHLEYYGDLDGDTRHAASTRACYEKPRSKGGQLGHLYDTYFGKEGGAPTELWDARIHLDRMSWRPQALVDGNVTNNVVIEHYRPEEEYSRKWRDGLHQDALFYRGQVLKATIQVVLEPLKTRVISKGESVPYYLSKPLQKRLHSVLRRFPEFRLIGAPLQATDLMDIEQNRVEGGEGAYEWFSIDYSAATDGLSARLSAAIMERLLRSQRSDLREIWMNVLAPHMCEYPPGYPVPPVQQTNGQLMGSILSFPILCIANLGLYLYAIRDDPRSISQKCDGVLVNGDDMLYVARRSRWSTHVALGEKVGLKMSPGKAYHDRVYANANSACYHFRLRERVNPGLDWSELDPTAEQFTCGLPPTLPGPTGTPKVIPFLNSGLYFGQNKVMNKVTDGIGYDEERPQQSRVAVLEELLRGVRPGVPARLREIFAGYIKRHRGDIDTECGDRNLFISRGLGGMGLTPDPHLRFHITPAQRQEAFRRYKAQPNGHLGFGPLLGREVSETDVALREPWIVTESAQRDPPRFKFRPGLPMLGKHLCLQPFRVCDVRRRRPAGLVRTISITSEWDELDPTALSLDVRPRYRLEDRPFVREGVSERKAALKKHARDLVEYDECDHFGFETERYHILIDTHYWVESATVPALSQCDDFFCDCGYAQAHWGRARYRATSTPDPGSDLFHEQHWD